MTDFYAYQRIIGKIEDDAALRQAFIQAFDAGTKADAVRFGLRYGQHLLELTGIVPAAEVAQAFSAMQRWLDGMTNYHEARNIAFGVLHRHARAAGDEVTARFYRCMGQIACIPHVKFHALWASDFAITLVNRLRPGDKGAVTKERQTQVSLMLDARRAEPEDTP